MGATIFSGSAVKLLKAILKIPGSTSGTLSITPAAVTTDHTVTWPANNAAGVLTNGGTGTLSWGAGSAATDAPILKTDPSTYVNTILAGEAISIRDAVCLDLDNSGNYRVFKTDYTKTNRHTTHVGFATAAATVTPHIQTWTLSAALVASNVIAYTVNGQVFSTTYASSSDATLQAIATAIATNGDVASATVTVVGGNQTGTDDRVITITGKGGIPINITGTGVTAGASQATITLNTTQAGTGQAVSILRDGPLGGFSALTAGLRYYAGNTAGAITNAPSSTNPVLVGQAISADTVWAFPKTTIFATPVIFVESHGNVAAALSATTNHFNFVSWSAQTADGTAAQMSQVGDCSLGINHEYIDYETLAENARVLYHSQWNKTSWVSATNRVTARNQGGMGILGSTLYVAKGVQPGSVSGVIDAWNGVSWTATVGTMSQNAATAGCFVQGGLVHSVGGNSTGGANYNVHDTWNGSSVSTSTVLPETGRSYSGTSGSGATGLAAGMATTTHSYIWNGSWSASITMSVVVDDAGPSSNNAGPASGYNPGASMNFVAGGTSSRITTVQQFNNFAWSTTTAASIGKERHSGGCI